MTKKQHTGSDAKDISVDTIPFPDEIAHLQEINLKLGNAFADAELNVGLTDKQYMDTKRYMAQYRGELDPHELFQNELALKQIDRTGVFAVGVRDKLAKLKDSPYFARIDFHMDTTSETDSFYIGRFAFNHDNELLISDWRSPVASMFYDCEVGPAGYRAPSGYIAGNLTRKRQFKIKNSILEYVLESSVHIQDTILQQELSHTSDEKMKSIIATIQKEQNSIIRNEKSGTLIIQGVAGSGKTSIALHRIAFLLYRFKDRLSAQHIAIISPNKVFGDYIANVLPELGEEPIYGLSFEEIAQIQLDGVICFEPDKDPLEAKDNMWADRVRFKSTLEFVKLLDEFIAQMTNTVFEAADYTYGSFSANAQTINARFLAYHRYPIKQRLQLIADDIYDRFKTDNYMEEDIPKSKTILKALNKMLKVKSTLALYKGFYEQIKQRGTFDMPASKTLEWADVYPFLYIHAAYAGLREGSIIKHLVVDEMQDYTPIQYAVLNKLFPCQKTILGDFGQCINPNHLNTLEDICQLYSGAEVVKLTKSYRSTYEIISFAQQFNPIGSVDAIERHGDIPALVQCYNMDDTLMWIINRIKEFSHTAYSSLGIIVKNNHDAQELYGLLSPEVDVHIISPKSCRFKNGVSITSVQMSKGLEFDEVIIPYADDETYHSHYDRSLLYIACTRAMHRLTLLYFGEIPPFMKQTYS